MISDHYRMVLYYTHEYVQVKKMRANVFSLAVKPAGGNLKLMESKICGNWCAPSMKLISNETLSIVEIRVPVGSGSHWLAETPFSALYLSWDTIFRIGHHATECHYNPRYMCILYHSGHPKLQLQNLSCHNANLNSKCTSVIDCQSRLQLINLRWLLSLPPIPAKRSWHPIPTAAHNR